ncbi:hypothetical protein ANANG_G00069930 [Anguilla anguilla]|uniref:Uncharacterized protein n=1 Tax=Anguilla anguilla TaxID=7936 RepID=A0A9D3MQE7_ANGAN|nr:hypothetical protein ANANG_G00069930 [Anguilla anguilla]
MDPLVKIKVPEEVQAVPVAFSEQAVLEVEFEVTAPLPQKVEEEQTLTAPPPSNSTRQGCRDCSSSALFCPTVPLEAPL